jgi:uncharacterized membrane protein YkvA (DUF1232 family)
MMWEIVLGVVVALVIAWAALLVVLVVARPRGSSSRDAFRVLPDLLRMLRRLATDCETPRAARVRLWLLLAYLAMPLDVVPDFIPVIGYADDAIITLLVVRSVVRRAGIDMLRSHWTGDASGWATILRLAGLSDTVDATTSGTAVSAK